MLYLEGVGRGRGVGGGGGGLEGEVLLIDNFHLF